MEHLKGIKLHLVAQGYSQRYGQDSDDNFSQVVRFESLKTVIALAVQNGLGLHQMSVTSPFLNGGLRDRPLVSRTLGGGGKVLHTFN